RSRDVKSTPSAHSSLGAQTTVPIRERFVRADRAGRNGARAGRAEPNRGLGAVDRNAAFALRRADRGVSRDGAAAGARRWPERALGALAARGPRGGRRITRV